VTLGGAAVVVLCGTTSDSSSIMTNIDDFLVKLQARYVF
jgi:hypothetical protein